MGTPLTSRDQRLLGLTDFKCKLIDTLIDYSEKHHGKITTAQLEQLRDGLKSYATKMEIIETLEEDKD
jgi:hypothetical protein